MTVAPKPSVSLANYDILELIGSGSCGLVYLGRDLRTNQLCALKEFPTTPQNVQTFFRELSILFTLNHINIVRCLNLVYGQSKKNYLIFEYANGGNLRDLIEKKKFFLPIEALKILKQIASGLAHAHSANIVHRDLKPENILICQHDDLCCYKISDLGIASNLKSDNPEVNITGSPAYMAPEQFYDRSTLSSDIYSLGVIFFELLTGRRPFEGLPARLFTAHSSEQADFSLITDKYCRELAINMMAKQPSARTPSAEHLLQEIESLLNPLYICAPAIAPKDATSLPAPQHKPEKLLHQATFEVPGTQHIFALHGHYSNQLLCADLRQSDLLNLNSGRISPQCLSQPILATSHNLQHYNPNFFSSKNCVYSCRNGHSLERLFSHTHKTETVLYQEKTNTLLLADSQKLCCYTLDGKKLWQYSCENYYLKPCLHVAANGLIYISSGPANPALHILDSTGKSLALLPLSAPVIGLFSAADHDHLSAVTLGLGEEAPAQLHHFNQTSLLDSLELPNGVFQMKNHGNFLCLFSVSRKLYFAHSNGSIFDYLTVSGDLMDDAWFTGSGIYAVLTHTGTKSEVISYRSTPKPSPSPNINVTPAIHTSYEL